VQPIISNKIKSFPNGSIQYSPKIIFASCFASEEYDDGCLSTFRSNGSMPGWMKIGVCDRRWALVNAFGPLETIIA